MKIKFCGAAQSVTGSCHMISFNGGNILVDCGMRQGSDTKTELGTDGFPFAPADISAVLLTHAHIDHTGLVPLLVKRGFTGKIITTSATCKLSGIMLPDSGHIQEQEAEYQTRKNLRAGKPEVFPMYTAQDALNSLKYFSPVDYGSIVDIMPGVKARFTDVGHLLGSAAIEIWVEEDGKTQKLAFSGDIGRDDRPIICDPQAIEGADYLVIEGTYGDRNHEVSTSEAKEAQFANILRMALIRGGNIVIPSFAVGRTQEILYYIKMFLKKGTVPGLENVPVYIDSPLGISATKIYEECVDNYYDEETKAVVRKYGSPFDFPTLRVAQTSDESKLINDQRGSNIIISSSGMCDAGRIRHHLKHNLYRADSTIVFVGYQAEGTLGRFLLDGAKKVKLFGEEVRVNATIERIEGFSGHAGRNELIEWVREMKNQPSHVFLVHGEEDVLESFGAAVRSLGYKVDIPVLCEEFPLDGKGELHGIMPATTPISDAAITNEQALRMELARVTELIDALNWKDDKTKLLSGVLEADIKSFVEKWRKLLY